MGGGHRDLNRGHIPWGALAAQTKEHAPLEGGSDKGAARGHKARKPNKKNIVFFFPPFFKDFLSRGQETSLIPMI